MNQRLTNQLAGFPEAVAAVDSNEAIQTLVVDLESAVLKSNLEDYTSQNEAAAFVARDYLVGEANTRGLSWKLNLLRLVSAANFCQLLRVGVHGGNTRVLGQEENLDTTFVIYDGLVTAYEALSAKAFTDFTDKNKGEDDAAVHRVGWVNKYLIDAPNEVFQAVDAARTQAIGSNSKMQAMVESKTEGLKALRETLMPPKAEKAPKEPKEKKAPKGKKKSDAEIIADQDAAALEAMEGTGSGSGELTVTAAAD